MVLDLLFGLWLDWFAGCLCDGGVRWIKLLAWFLWVLGLVLMFLG